MKIALLYEHPTWSNQLIQCFRKNGIELKLLNIDELIFDTGQLDMDFDLLINRVNIMPCEQRDSAVVFHTLHFLNWLELTNVHIINGARAHYTGSSKAVQNGIFSKGELTTNERLVERMVRIAGILGREIATPDEAREIMHL